MRVRHELSGDMTTELLLGDGGKPSAFVSEAERRAAWRWHGEEFVGGIVAHGLAATTIWAYREYGPQSNPSGKRRDHQEYE